MICALCKTETDDYLCAGCTVATADRLNDLPGRYRALAAFLQPGARRPESGRTRPAEAPLPIVEPVATLRGPGGIVGVLEDWSSAVYAERGLPEPVRGGTIQHRIKVAVYALGYHLEWIATRWDMAGQFAEEIRQLARTVDGFVDPEERAQEFGPCPRLLGMEAVCGAVLLLYPDRATIECDRCGASWSPARWLDLAEAQQERQAGQETAVRAA